MGLPGRKGEKGRLEFLEVLGSQVFLARQEIWDPKDSKEQGEEEVKRVTEVRWDCQEEKEIRAKREKSVLKGLLVSPVLKVHLDQKELMVQLDLKEILDLLDLLVLLESFHYFHQIFSSKEILLKPTEDQREMFEETTLMEKSNQDHGKTAMLT